MRLLDVGQVILGARFDAIPAPLVELCVAELESVRQLDIFSLVPICVFGELRLQLHPYVSAQSVPHRETSIFLEAQFPCVMRTFKSELLLFPGLLLVGLISILTVLLI